MHFVYKGCYTGELSRTTVHDVDECLFDCVEKHVIITPKIARDLGLNWPEEDLPSYAQVCALGGTHNAYSQFPGYAEINKFLCNNAHFNTHLNVIEGSLEALTLLQELEMLDFYLTTRPESMAQATLEQLANAGFPKAEVVARPDSVPQSRTSEWKNSVLRERHLENGRPKLMIDDSLSMVKFIRTENHPKINGILHNGPITPKGNGEMAWPSIVELLSNAKTWDILNMELSSRSK